MIGPRGLLEAFLQSARQRTCGTEPRRSEQTLKYQMCVSRVNKPGLYSNSLMWQQDWLEVRNIYIFLQSITLQIPWSLTFIQIAEKVSSLRVSSLSWRFHPKRANLPSSPQVRAPAQEWRRHKMERSATRTERPTSNWDEGTDTTLPFSNGIFRIEVHI